MFQTVFLSIRSLKVQIQRQVLFRPVSQFIYLFLSDALHVSDGFSVHHQEHKTAHTASGICHTRFAILFISVRRSTCFRWVFRPSSGAQNWTYSVRYLSDPFHNFIYFCKTLYMFQTDFPSIICSTKLHIQRQVFVRPILLTDASQTSSR